MKVLPAAGAKNFAAAGHDYARAALTLTGPRDPSAPKPLKMGLFYHILMLYRKLNQDHADMCILE